MRPWRARLTAFILVSNGLLGAPPGAAQPADYPTHDLRVICNFAPGTSYDVFTRFFAERLSAAVSQNAKVENRTKNFGLDGTQTAATAKPDGYTLLITPGDLTLAAAVHAFRKPKFDPLKDFAPVTSLAKAGYVVLVSPKTSLKTITDLTAYQKSRKDDASFGANSDSSLAAAELYNKLAGIKPTRSQSSTAQALADELTSGNIDFIVLDIPAAADLIASRKLRALAVTGEERSSMLPDVPTMEQAGVKGFGAVEQWWGVFVPAKTPQPVVDKLESVFNRITASNEAKKFLGNAKMDALPGDAKSLRTLLTSEVDRWAELVKIAGIQPK